MLKIELEQRIAMLEAELLKAKANADMIGGHLNEAKYLLSQWDISQVPPANPEDAPAIEAVPEENTNDVIEE